METSLCPSLFGPRQRARNQSDNVAYGKAADETKIMKQEQSREYLPFRPPGMDPAEPLQEPLSYLSV